jgi:hypothetical protein
MKSTKRNAPVGGNRARGKRMNSNYIIYTERVIVNKKITLYIF